MMSCQAWRLSPRSHYGADVLVGLLAGGAPGMAPEDGDSPIPSAPPLAPEALEIAQECAAFLEAAQDRPRAARALRRAWTQALALARHDLREVPGDFPEKGENPAPAQAPPGKPEAPVRTITRKH